MTKKSGKNDLIKLLVFRSFYEWYPLLILLIPEHLQSITGVSTTQDACGPQDVFFRPALSQKWTKWKFFHKILTYFEYFKAYTYFYFRTNYWQKKGRPYLRNCSPYRLFSSNRGMCLIPWSRILSNSGLCACVQPRHVNLSVF